MPNHTDQTRTARGKWVRVRILQLREPTLLIGARAHHPRATKQQ